MLPNSSQLLEGYSRRPQLQERLTAQVAYTLHERLRARGAIVGEADHVSMTVQGSRNRGA